MTNSQENHVPPFFVLLGYLQGEWIARCIQVAAILGLADLLTDGPRSIQELAQATNTHAPSLYRLLRGLASLGIFTEVEPNTFAQTALSEALRCGQPGSIGYLAKMYGQEWQLKAWEQLEYSLRTGKAAVDSIYGMDIWKYLNTYPTQSQLFDRALTSLSDMLNLPLAQSYDFSTFATLVDIGGGQGSFLMTILSLHPGLQGVLFDRPSVIELAHEQIKPEFRDRLQLVAGDVLTALPEGGDAYMMKAVLHDWCDEDCLRILQNCRQVMKPGAKLLLVEPVIWPGDSSKSIGNKFLDLQMLINSTGRERTAEEFAHLLEASGFQLIRTLPTKANFGIIEGVPV